MANLAISAVCNQNCVYCFTVDHLERGRRTARRFLPVSRFQERLDFLARSGMDRVRLLGGEPTLHPRFVELVERARAAGMKVTVFSNGLMPPAALDCLAALPPQVCTVLVNVDERQAAAPKDEVCQRQRAALRRLGRRAILGFTIYRTDFSLAFLFPLVAATGCKPLVRLGMAQPCLSGTNRYLHPRQYRAVAASLARFAPAAADAGVTLDLDCGFVRCMFATPELKTLQEAGAKVGWRCNPILDVDIEGDVIHCYPLASLMSLPLTPTSDAPTLRAAFAARTRAYRRAGVFKECSTCPFKTAVLPTADGPSAANAHEQEANLDECPGGCLATTVRRFRRTPFTVRVPLAGEGSA